MSLHHKGEFVVLGNFFTSATFPDLELHAARKFAEGHPDCVWTTILQADGTEATPVDPSKEREIDPSIFNAGDSLEDIARVRAEGFEVDDDNEALPEKRPALDAPPIQVSADGLLQGQEWGWDGLDHQVHKGGGYEDPSFKNGPRPLYQVPPIWVA